MIVQTTTACNDNDEVQKVIQLNYLKDVRSKSCRKRLYTNDTCAQIDFVQTEEHTFYSKMKAVICLRSHHRFNSGHLL
ncbi:hypothetical protein BIW11_09620 [Tropilaelaps mercedesae]|uniref:Uncharacterized protein n=1 Tax=Tropilaelaps mercedesae TaxID=418985 RepID=A0A1V9XJQ2_9ACAR|nr:hypothetical protein BIW11_09620 [Tropilaelaps mercedesae]